MLTLMVVAVLAAGPEVTEAGAPQATDATWTVQLRVSAPRVTFINGVAPGLWGAMSFTPATGVSVERAVGRHWSVTLEVDGSLSTSDGSVTAVRVGATPGLRWYPRRALDGPWLGAQVDVSTSWYGATGGIGGLGGLGTVPATTSVSVSPDLLVGWTHRFDERLLFTLAAGPTLWWSRRTTTFGGQPSTPSVATLGLHGFASAGLAF